MADQDFKSVPLVYGGQHRVAYCQFTTAGTSAPTGVTGRGVTGVTRTGVGTFEVTLAHKATNVHPVLTIGGAAAALLGRASVRSITLSTKKLVIATTESDAAPVDIETTGVTVYLTVFCEGV
jgi:hypothetical protein